MAILTMKKVSLYALQSNRKAILEQLQRWEVVEAIDIPVDEQAADKLDTGGRIAQLERQLMIINQALGVLDEYAPVKSPMFSSRKGMTLEQYQAGTEQRDPVHEACNSIVNQTRKIAEHKSNMARLQAGLTALEPYENLPYALSFKGTQQTRAYTGTVAAVFESQSALYEAFAEHMEPDALKLCEIQLLSSMMDATAVCAVCHASVAAEAEQALKAMGFIRFSESADMTVRDKQKSLKDEIEREQKAVERCEDAIKRYAPQREAIRMLHDSIAMRRDKYAVMNRLLMTPNTFMLKGYIPERYAQGVLDNLSKQFSIAYEIEDLAPDEELPVVFSNNGFVRPVENITTLYSLPSRGDIDPNPVMSFFYYLFFGIMLGDAGYGILLALGTFIINKKFDLEPSMKRSMKMFFYCGISTTIWGFMFGSFFGNSVGAIASTFFGSDAILPPIWFDPVSNPMQMLFFSLGLGIVHMFAGMIIKFYMLCREGKVWDAIWDIGMWFLLLIGLIGMIALPSIGMPGAATPMTIIAIIGGAGLLLFTGRHHRNIFKRISSGLGALYNITSYVSDILSYSRLLALGLATGVIATVMNTMGTLGGGSIVGIILFLVVFVIGQVFNMGINVLGAYVHTNRLQYVEFFGKFYEGGGRAFKPLGVNTKYYKFREANKNG